MHLDLVQEYEPHTLGDDVHYMSGMERKRSHNVVLCQVLGECPVHCASAGEGVQERRKKAGGHPGRTQ